MFPEVKKVTNTYNGAELSARYCYQAPIVMRYLENKLHGWNISDFFDEVGAEKVALYAVTEFTKYVLLDLAQNKCKEKVVCIGDKAYQRYRQGIERVPVVSPEKVASCYMQGEVDKIVICSVSHANAIIDDFISRGVSLADLITVTGAIFSYNAEGSL